MIALLLDNLGSVLVTVGLVTVLGLILWGVLRRKRQGRSSCGCGCASCPMADKCHGEKEEK